MDAGKCDLDATVAWVRSLISAKEMYAKSLGSLSSNRRGANASNKECASPIMDQLYQLSGALEKKNKKNALML